MISTLFKSTGAGLVQDYATEKAFEALQATFTSEHHLAYEKIERASSNALWYLYIVFGGAILSVIVSNVLFWGYDFGFWYIFLTNILVFPYNMYRSIKSNGIATYNKVRFYAGLSANIQQLGGDARVAMEKFMSK